ncbi:DUF6777 domain-containing protein [Streptomyces sp. NPDC008343]|uniref:DUF6777 domain-containing protein n=1 Tax=Streptomyces sp. NPDC008343 TaxID=3364828 RepID=UPI0036E631BA
MKRVGGTAGGSGNGASRFRAQVRNSGDENQRLGRDAQVRAPAAHGGLQQGDTPGLYGGSKQPTLCDVVRLEEFLTDPGNERKAQAWAAALSISAAEIPGYLGRLTPVLLRHDTLVRNHDYKKGKAVPFNALLQTGIAILVDERGLPAVKCSCGNPLRPFEGDTTRIKGTTGEDDTEFDTRERRAVPDLTGTTFGQASRRLAGKGLAAALVGGGLPPDHARVTASDPPAGTELRFGEYVTLSVAGGATSGGSSTGTSTPPRSGSGSGSEPGSSESTRDASGSTPSTSSSSSTSTSPPSGSAPPPSSSGSVSSGPSSPGPTSGPPSAGPPSSATPPSSEPASSDPPASSAKPPSPKDPTSSAPPPSPPPPSSPPETTSSAPTSAPVTSSALPPETSRPATSAPSTGGPSASSTV